MQLVRAFSASARRLKQPFFETESSPSVKEKQYVHNRNRFAKRVNSHLASDAKLVRGVFHCPHHELQNLRLDLTTRIAEALATLQAPTSFQVQDLTFSNILRPPTIDFPTELAIIDLEYPVGLPPSTPKSAIPRINYPGVVANTLSRAGFKTSISSPDPIGRYPRAGFIRPARLHIDVGQRLGQVTLTLPGATTRPFHDFLVWFKETHAEFKKTLMLLVIWARSHSMPLNTQTIALMLVASMQSEEPLFDAWAERRGWAPVEHGRSQTVASVDIDFKKVRPLPTGSFGTDFISFFRHWARLIFSCHDDAYTIRRGRMDQKMPRLRFHPQPITREEISNFEFNPDKPVEKFLPWRTDPLVIQDPFMVTYNHAQQLPLSEVIRLADLLKETEDHLYTGRPLAMVFGKHAALPGSAAEAKLLRNPRLRAMATTLLKEASAPEPSTPAQPTPSTAPQTPEETESPPVEPVSARDTPDPRLRRVMWSHRRGFHTCNVSLDQRRSAQGLGLTPEPIQKPEFRRPRREASTAQLDAFPRLPRRAFAGREPEPRSPISVPEPQVRPARKPFTARVAPSRAHALKRAGQEHKPEHDEQGWGLNPPRIRPPEFWRPDRTPLTVPVRTRSSSLVPLARESKAGVAYKDALSRPKGFHTSAACLKRPDIWNVRVPARETDPRVRDSRRETLLAVQNVVRKAYGGEYSVEIFGSIRYGISSASSDLDLVILDPTRKNGFAPSGRKLGEIYHIRPLSRVLRKAGFKILEVVPDAAVPIVKFQDPRTGQSCDINVNDRLGLYNSDLIKRYCELNPVLVDMIMFIKAWAKPRGLNNSGSRKMPTTFSSYALVMMTIGFLQHRGLLPNLQEGLEPLEPGNLQGTFWLRLPRVLCCDIRYHRAEGWTPPENVPVAILLRDWFKFWAVEFSLAEEMISIRHGGRLRRDAATKRTDFAGVLWNIDPFIRTKNLTRNIGHKSIGQFKMECHAMVPTFGSDDLAIPQQLVEARNLEARPTRLGECPPAREEELLLLWQDAPKNLGGFANKSDAEPPSVRVDSFGRLMELVQPTPPPKRITDVESDVVGWGLLKP
ncbi:hypothetical protein B0H15DRAFT_816648 [Mycena belliarum]|uniref:Poly(A) RNA polymerase mitochondrial-like central palm domain-containing protein n=1 Tax=Mycena belliarum TaxID=1033014 RepID=A0AAD6UHD0_9AGAR|nr:hypothetical protein B0H15DRAFT_816648 [Mycena belliae]